VCNPKVVCRQRCAEPGVRGMCAVYAPCVERVQLRADDSAAREGAVQSNVGVVAEPVVKTGQSRQRKNRKSEAV